MLLTNCIKNNESSLEELVITGPAEDEHKRTIIALISQVGRVGKQLRVLNLGGVKVLPSKSKKIYGEYFGMLAAKEGLKTMFVHQFRLDTTESDLWAETFFNMRCL